MAALAAQDEAKRATDAAKNELEAYIIGTRERLEEPRLQQVGRPPRSPLSPACSTERNANRAVCGVRYAVGRQMHGACGCGKCGSWGR